MHYRCFRQMKSMLYGNYSAPPRLLSSSGVAAMLESSHITHMLRILRIRRLAREQNPRGAE